MLSSLDASRGSVILNTDEVSYFEESHEENIDSTKSFEYSTVHMKNGTDIKLFDTLSEIAVLIGAEG